jgi:hypothetical protein
MFDDLLGHIVFAKSLEDITANDGVDSLEAFTSFSILVLWSRGQKEGARRCRRSYDHGGHVEKSSGEGMGSRRLL